MTDLSPRRIWTDRRVPASTGVPKLLVVDDNTTGAAAVVAFLTQEGFETQYASGGLDAVDLIQQWIPAIILLDINMPEYDGFRTARILKRLLPTSKAVIIAYTAQGEGDIYDRGVRAGFDAYWQKGYPPETLVGLIRKLMH